MKIAACVILYQPGESVEQNLKSYIDHVEKVYVIDNTEIQAYNNQVLLSDHKIKYIHDGKNDGIAKRLNQACDFATKDGFDYLLTMDQDSFFDESSIKKYLQCIENFDYKGQVSMFGINHQNQSKTTNCDFKKVNFLITSGSIINLSAYKNVGPFDENLFIDFVDTEYCFRSVQKGFDVIEFPNIFMHHEIGTITNRRSVKTLKTSSRSLHSFVRLYYMARNFLYVNNKYKSEFRKELSLHKKDLLNRIKNKLFYSTERMKTISVLFKAYKDYKKNKMGKQL